jgi:hypothetical protein
MLPFAGWYFGYSSALDETSARGFPGSTQRGLFDERMMCRQYA